MQRLSRFVRELRVPALEVRRSTRWPHLYMTPCCGTLTRHYSTTRLSASTIRLPRYVDRRASILQKSSVPFSGIQRRLRRRVHHSSRCALRLGTGTTIQLSSACSRYRSTRFRRVRSARLHSSQASAMSGRSGATYASVADTVWLAFCPSSSSSSRFSGAFGLAPPGLVCGRADWSPSFATRVSRVSFPRHS